MAFSFRYSWLFFILGRERFTIADVKLTIGEVVKKVQTERRRKCNFQFAKKSTRVLMCAKLYQRLEDIKKKHSAEYLCLYICIYLFIFILQQSSNFVDSLIFLLMYKKLNWLLSTILVNNIFKICIIVLCLKG